MTIRNALIVAASLLAYVFLVGLARKNGAIGEETALRAVQVVMGLVVVYYGNLAPKTLEPLHAGCEPSRVQALQRFSGWTLVLGGLGYSLFWLLAPIEYAKVGAISILAASLVLVGIRFVWTLKFGRRQQSPPGL